MRPASPFVPDNRLQFGLVFRNPKDVDRFLDSSENRKGRYCSEIHEGAIGNPKRKTYYVVDGPKDNHRTELERLRTDWSHAVSETNNYEQALAATNKNYLGGILSRTPMDPAMAEQQFRDYEAYLIKLAQGRFQVTSYIPPWVKRFGLFLAGRDF